jgi:hypothetical protein
MWPFRRRRVGKHALGAAVTAIPRAVPVVPAAPAPPPPPPPPAPVVEEPRGPRVELGFRDGSTAALAPESAQAKALTEIASVLTRRD